MEDRLSYSDASPAYLSRESERSRLFIIIDDALALPLMVLVQHATPARTAESE